MSRPRRRFEFLRVLLDKNGSWLIAFAGFAAGLAVIAVPPATAPAAAQPPKAPVITPAPQAPTLTTPANLGAKPGERVELTLTGTNLADPTGVLLSCPGEGHHPDRQQERHRRREAAGEGRTCRPTAPIGLHTIRVATKHGVSNVRPFVVDELAARRGGRTTNRTKDTAAGGDRRRASSPAAPTPRRRDFFKVKVTAGQTLTFEVLARRIGSPLDPIVVLHDAKTKRELVDLYADDTPGLAVRLPADAHLQGGRRVPRRGARHDLPRRGGLLLPAADRRVPRRDDRVPAGGRSAARPRSIGFAGPGTDDIPPVSVKAPTDADARGGVRRAEATAGVSGWPVPVRLSDYPESAEQEPNNEPAKANKLPVPGGVSGRFDKAKRRRPLRGRRQEGAEATSPPRRRSR